MIRFSVIDLPEVHPSFSPLDSDLQFRPLRSELVFIPASLPGPWQALRSGSERDSNQSLSRSTSSSAQDLLRSNAIRVDESSAVLLCPLRGGLPRQDHRPARRKLISASCRHVRSSGSLRLSPVSYVFCYRCHLKHQRPNSAAPRAEQCFVDETTRSHGSCVESVSPFSTKRGKRSC